ncbi:MAG: hypothetical protein R3C18_24835 [Planctomycetaceae bacterium]
MFRLSLATLWFVALASGIRAEDRASTLQKPIAIPANVGFSTNISDDGQVATVLFDNAFVELSPVVSGARGTHRQTASATKVMTVNFPYKTEQRSVDMTLHIRGFCDVAPQANARLVVCAGSATHVVDLSADENVELSDGAKEDYNLDEGGADFFDEVKFVVQRHAAEPVCQLTFFLEVDRDSDQPDSGSALLVVDTIDLSVAPPAKLKR